MDIFIIMLIAVIVLFLVFLTLNLLNKPQKETSKPVSKPEPKKVEQSEQKPTIKTQKQNPKIELSTRPDFSDMLPEKKETANSIVNKRRNQNYQEINGGRLKIIQTSEGIEKDTDLYIRRSENETNNKLVKEIKNLSPEMKTVLFGKVLDKKED